MTDDPVPPQVDSPGHLDLLIRFLANGEPHHCPRCRYALRELTTDRCPECGTQIALRLAPRRELTWRYLAGLIALSATAGFSILGMLLMMMFGGLDGTSGFATMAAVSTTLTGFWLAGRLRFENACDEIQLTLMFASFAIPAVCFFVVWSTV
ncbi:MAG: hypothetical protein KC983_00085 [Phycisphaerales bacterium]|nr:hypothetical protein [Phycisphaerales bacterium]